MYKVWEDDESVKEINRNDIIYVYEMEVADPAPKKRLRTLMDDDTYTTVGSKNSYESNFTDKLVADVSPEKLINVFVVLREHGNRGQFGTPFVATVPRVVKVEELYNRIAQQLR